MLSNSQVRRSRYWSKPELEKKLNLEEKSPDPFPQDWHSFGLRLYQVTGKRPVRAGCLSAAWFIDPIVSPLRSEKKAMSGNDQSENATDTIVFDHELDSESEHSRLSWLLIIGAVMLAVFVTAAWLAYQRGVAQGRFDMARATASAADASGPATDPRTSTAPTPRAATPSVGASRPSPAIASASGTGQVSMDFRGEAPEPLPANAVEPVSAPVSPQPASAAPTSAAQTVIPASAAPATNATPAGKNLLQIGSYKSQAEADSAWSIFKAKHAELLAGKTSTVRQVDLGSRGTWYRLLVVTGDESGAASLCDKLKADGDACLPVK